MCAMLEIGVVDAIDDIKVQMITALQSTAPGRKLYAQLCDKQSALRELVSENKRLENVKYSTYSNKRAVRGS